jgi:uncharacterized repeat protein (TIGR01451 family)
MKRKPIAALALGLAALSLRLPHAPQPAELSSQVEAASAAPADPIAISVDTVVASGFTHPVQVTHAGDGSGRLFVVEQPGTVRVIKDGGGLPEPYLDLRQLTVDAGERGLLSVAFHPNYPANGYAYVNYTRATDGATVVARYTVSSSDPDRADPASGQTILTVDQPYANHNGGQLAFGTDGYLYIGMGDGGSGGDPLEAAQNPNSLLGALLRIDVDGGVPYAIPNDNPYAQTAGRDEIWATGLRNPWRFSFDRATGDLYIGDVGQNLWEEVSFQAASTLGGLNFGWDCLEGTHEYEWTSECAAVTLTAPIAEYSHSDGRSITGGFVYRGTVYPRLQGLYFYGDFVTGKIWYLRKTASDFTAPVMALDTALNISAFGEDESGELYIVDRAGSVRRLVDADGPGWALSASKQPSVPGADPGEAITYTVALANSGSVSAGPAVLTDTIPVGLKYVPGSLTATAGTTDDVAAPTLTWQGTLAPTAAITITYSVTATGDVTGSLVNHAQLTGPTVGDVDLASVMFVPRAVLTSTMRDLALPGTQPNGLAAAIAPSIDCDTCHSEPIYDRWRGTLMSQSARDVLMRAALTAANGFVPDAGDYCLRCHAPKGWLEGRSHPADGSDLNASDVANGVACALCHRMVDPVPTGGEAAAIDIQVRAALTTTVPTSYTGSAALIVDPSDNRRGPFTFSQQLPYHTAYQTDFLGQTSDATDRARLCGTCHDVDNPVLSWDPERQQYWPNTMDTPPATEKGALFPIERTYTEWQRSAYPTGVVAAQFAGAKADDTVSACQDCHMERQTGTAADAGFNPARRDCAGAGCLPEHGMAGGNTWMPGLLQDPAWRLNAASAATELDATARRAASMLHRAATLTLTLTVSDTIPVAIVRVTNETGHKLPTGYPEGRQMWLHVRAHDAAGALVYESGRYDPLTHTLIRDADIKVYEAKQGLTPELAALLGQPAGASLHFALNNTVAKDNRIPPRGYTQAAWDEAGLRPVGATYEDGQYWDETAYVLPATATRVSAVLRYQTASREYVDFLRANGGFDGEALYALWEDDPSPPVVMAIAADPANVMYLPLVLRRATAP